MNPLRVPQLAAEDPVKDSAVTLAISARPHAAVRSHRRGAGRTFREDCIPILFASPNNRLVLVSDVRAGCWLAMPVNEELSFWPPLRQERS